MKLQKLTYTAAISAALVIGLVQATPVHAKNNAYKEANRAAVSMWLQQQAQNGIVYPDPYTAGQALQYQQMTGINPANPYGYGQIYSPFNYGYNPYSYYGY